MNSVLLKHIEQTCDDLNSKKFSCIEEKINLACCLGERTYLLVAEIKRLKKQIRDYQKLHRESHRRRPNATCPLCFDLALRKFDKKAKK